MKTNTISTIAVILLAILATAAVAIALTLCVRNDATPAEPIIEAPAEEPAPVEEAAPAKVCVRIFKNYYDRIEDVVNEWLAENADVEIISIQNAVIDEHRTTVTIVYAEK